MHPTFQPLQSSGYAERAGALPAPPSSGVGVAIERLDNNVTETLEAVSRLYARLDPILRPMPNLVEQSPENKPSPDSPTVRSLSVLSDRLIQATMALNSLIGRIDL